MAKSFHEANDASTGEKTDWQPGPLSEAIGVVADAEKDRVRREHRDGCQCPQCLHLDMIGWPK